MMTGDTEFTDISGDQVEGRVGSLADDVTNTHSIEGIGESDTAFFAEVGSVGINRTGKFYCLGDLGSGTIGYCLNRLSRWAL